MMCGDLAICCPQSGTGEAINAMPPPNFSVPERSNLDYLGSQGHSHDHQDSYPIMPPGQMVNQQPATDYGFNDPSGRENSAKSMGSQSSARSGGRTASEWAAEQEQFAHLPPLPEGWLRVLSRSTNKIYFCYPETGETTFTEPTGPPPSKQAKSGQLPDGWTQMTSKSTGRTYFWHAGMQKSQFDVPTGNEVASRENTAKSSIPAAPPAQAQHDPSLPEGWVSMVSRSTGKPYYFNSVTQQSQFDRPTFGGVGSGTR